MYIDPVIFYSAIWIIGIVGYVLHVFEQHRRPASQPGENPLETWLQHKVEQDKRWCTRMDRPGIAGAYWRFADRLLH